MFHLLWVDAWDEELDEAAGSARCIDTAETAREALDLLLIRWPCCRRDYGPGELVVTDSEHRRVDLRSLGVLSRAALQTA